MRSILHDSNLTTQWLALIKEAESKILINLEEELEHYLVLLLIRFMTQPQMMHRSVALDFLACYTKFEPYPKAKLQKQLKEVGDRCLLLSGLFPDYAQRRGTQLSYFINLGRTAYDSLGEKDALYTHLSLEFMSLMNILLNLRYPSEDLNLEENMDLIHNPQQYTYQILKYIVKKRPH